MDSADAKLELVEECKEFARQDMSGNDCSHDFKHVMRVCRLALSIAAKESSVHKVDMFVIELAAILHDVKDHKYSGSLEDGASFVKEFLESRGCSQTVSDHVVSIVGNLSFTKENKSIKAGAWEDYQQKNSSIEFKCVQDADRLDAIGAVGIARCVTYSAAIGKEIYTEKDGKVDVDDYSTVVGHYTEKLCILKDLMKTDTGREMAARRHESMKLFIDEFIFECQQ